MQALINFFGYEFSWDSAVRLAAVVLSILITYQVPFRTKNERINAAKQFLVMFVIGVFISLGCFFMAQMFVFLWAISFQLTWILLLIVYFAIFNHDRHPAKWIMGVTLLATVFAMSEIGFAIPNLFNAFPFDIVFRWVHVFAAMLIVCFAVTLAN